MIDVAFEIEDVYFDAEVSTIVEGRAMADVQNAFPLLAGYMNKDGSVFVRTKDDKGVAGTYYDWLKFPYFSQLTAEG